MAPYRTVDRAEHVEAPRDTGIVGDIISQFADPLAFYRELVQNAIDAGSKSVEVRIEWDASAGVARAIVRDRGEGMTREIVEDQLLVLFRSTKEGVAGKIGKFGIGFASVLSPNPSIVVVNTARDGRRLVLHLQRDLTYQLFDGGPASQTGTSIEIDIPMAPTEVGRFIEDSLVALKRWCRHAAVPIELVAHAEPAGAPTTHRIDEPLALDALVQVRHEGGDGLVALVGISRVPYAGFFNHGLMLFETNEQLVGGDVAFKIQDAKLGHTISRDNVRRDARFDAVMAVVRRLASTELPAAAARALAEAAEEADPARYRDLVAAIGASDLVPAAQWVFPLLHPIESKRSIGFGALDATSFGAGAPSSITEMLAAAKQPVLDLSNLAVTNAIQRRAGNRIVDVRTSITLVERVEPTPQDLVLVDAVLAYLDAAFRKPGEIVLAKLDGALGYALTMAGGESHAVFAANGAQLFDREAADRTPFARMKPLPLLLNVEHAHVKAARAASDPQLAASHLARSILLAHNALEPDRSEKLLARTLAALGVT